jgi:HEAT repeats
MNTSNPISLDRALIFAALACSLAALLWPRSSERAQPATADLQPLRDEIASLRRSLDESLQQRTSAPASPEQASPDGVTIRQVHEWVWGLEQRLVQLEQGVVDSRLAASPATTPAPDVALARQQAMNSQASPEERLAALRALRSANARTTDVVHSMLQLQAASKDPKVRADIFRQLSGVKDAILKPPLIDAVLKDNDPKVREEAAETLASFTADPYVRSALNAAAQNDADPDVQKQARETLEQKRAR